MFTMASGQEADHGRANSVTGVRRIHITEYVREMSDRPTWYPVIIEYHDGKYEGSAQSDAGGYHISIHSKLLKSGEPSNQPSFGTLSDKYEITAREL